MMLRHYASPKTGAVNLHLVPARKPERPFDFERDAYDFWIEDLCRPVLGEQVVAEMDAMRRVFQRDGYSPSTGRLIEAHAAAHTGI